MTGKKFMAGILSMALIMGSVFSASALAANKESATQGQATFAQISLNHSMISVAPGERFKLDASAKLPSGMNESIEWTSEDGSIATVMTDGWVTAKRNGNTIITAAVGTLKVRCRVEVAVDPTHLDLQDSSVTRVGYIKTGLAYETIDLGIGNMQVYDFGELKLHAYETKDPISNENFLLETEDGIIVVELTPFYDNIEELQKYIYEIGKPVNSVVVAYHPAGADAYTEATIYASEGLGEAALVVGFIEAFGDIFDGNMPTEYELVKAGPMTIDGVEFNVVETADAFDLEIPAINVYLTHMLGASTHNILANVGQIDSMIAEMKKLQEKDYALILTGHDVPRTIGIAAEKIDYLEKTKEIISSNDSAEAFTEAMQEAFPNYLGDSYLEMSAGMLFAVPAEA